MRKAALFLAVFAAFEAGATAFRPASHPLLDVSRRKEALYERMLRSNDEYDVFFVGSSLTQNGLDPAIFDAALGSKSFNAGIAGRANVAWTYRMVEEIIQRKRPRLIIYGLESFALSADPKPKSNGMFTSLALFRNRDEIKRWLGELARGTFSLPGSAPPPGVELLNQILPVVRSQTLHGNGFLAVDGEARRDVNHIPNTFQVNAGQEKALNDLLALVRREGVELVFVQYPEHHGPADTRSIRYAGFKAYMRTHVVSKGFQYFDFNSDLAFPHADISNFFDPSHLNVRGAALFTRTLAEEMRRRRALALRRP
jgi:hypothetical protein